MAEFPLQNGQFEKAFSEAVQKILQGLGQSVSKAISFHLEQIQGVPSADVIKDPKLFASGLEKIFSSGAKVIEDRIIQTMCRELGVDYEKTEGTFEQKLALVRTAANSRRTALIFN